MQVEQIARWVSRIGHPFIVPLVALLIVTLHVLPPAQAIGWLRIVLRRHTPLEVGSGALLGALVALALINGQ